MKKVVYDEEKIKELVKVLNGLHVIGIEQARRIAYIGSLLDSGEIREEE